MAFPAVYLGRSSWFFVTYCLHIVLFCFLSLLLRLFTFVLFFYHHACIATSLCRSLLSSHKLSVYASIIIIMQIIISLNSIYGKGSVYT